MCSVTVVKKENALGNIASNTYDLVGNQLTQTDAKGQKDATGQTTTTYTYNSFDELTSVTIPNRGQVNPKSQQNETLELKTSYRYDLNGNLTQIRNTNRSETANYNTMNFEYNRLNEMIKKTDALHQVTDYLYDQSGNLDRVRFPKDKDKLTNDFIQYNYNGANRLTSLSYNETIVYRFEFDPNGNKTKDTDVIRNRNWSYLYDKLNRIQTATSPDGSRQTNYYDKNSNRLRQEVISGGSIYNTRYNFSITDQNIEIVDHNNRKTHLSYDERDNLIQYKAGNSSVTTQIFDETNRLEKMVSTKSTGEVLSSYRYLYDENGNRHSVTDHTGKKITYEYDKINQLVSETDPISGNLIEYFYDALGNRNFKQIKNASNQVVSLDEYTYDAANQLTKVNGQNYEYDSRGNLTNDGTREFIWDVGGRLEKVINLSNRSTIALYEYDASGRRVKSTVNGIVTNYHYDGTSIRVLYETNSSGNLTTFYTYTDGGTLLSMTKVGQGTYYYHYNAHGDVIQLTDQNQNIVATYTYDAWGNILASNGPLAISNPYRYAGYRYDNETDFYYLMARYYNPKNGNFISRDPDPGDSDDPISQNAYIYGQNNPVMTIDPDGNWIWLVINGGISAYEAYKAYNEGYAQGKRGSSLMKHVAWAVGGNFIKVGKIFKFSKKLYSTAKGIGNIGKSYGKNGRFGTVVNNPRLKVSSFSGHAVNQAITRGVKTKDIQRTVNNPIAVSSQWGGQKFAYVSKEAVVVLDKSGRIVTIWGKNQFDNVVKQVIKDAGR